MDQVHDTYNMVHACEVANEAEKNIGNRRASGFNEFFEAVLNKECEIREVESGSGLGSEQGQASSGSKEKGKEKPRFGPAVEELKKWTKKLVKECGENATWKWTWGVDLTDEDLRRLIQGADRQHQVPHSGYDQDLPSDLVQSLTSVNLADWDDKNVQFDKLSVSISVIPELPSQKIPTYSSVLVDPSRNLIAKSEPDSVIEAFAKQARTKVTKAKKLLMQDEVDEPALFHNYRSEFVPQIALAPC